MRKMLKVRDVTLRDGQQSLFATRMTQDHIEPLLPLFRDAGFYALEVWGGAVPDSIMRYLGEDPWFRLESIRDAIGGQSHLTALSRGRNLFGYNPYPDDVIEGFAKHAVQSGITIMRVFDALNDTSNIAPTIKYIKQYGALADCTVCYTVDPYFSARTKVKSFLHGKALPSKIFTDQYFLEKAIQLEHMGADMITLKDMAGLIPPLRAGRIIGMMKDRLSVPVDFHTHCTPGYGLASTLMAILAGVDIIDTAILNFAGGPGAPPFEIIWIFCEKLGIETGVNIEVVSAINMQLTSIRKDLSAYDTAVNFPRFFSLHEDALPQEISVLFDKAIDAAKAGKQDSLLEACHAIEDWFGLPKPDIEVKEAEIPGGMYTNMLAQLRQLKLEHLLPRTLELIPEVRLVSGLPPLVTPTSQIVGAQAVNCAIDEEKGQALYTTKSLQFVNLVKGSYGKTPYPVDPDFRFKLCGVRDETPYDPRFYQKPANTVFDEYGGVKLASNEKEELLLDLFPNVAAEFLKNKVESDYLKQIHTIEAEKEQKFLAEKQAYDLLSEEEKQQRLLDGLYHYSWSSGQEEDFIIGTS